MGLQQFERRFERLVEGAFSRAFRGELQPVEIGRRLTREMDLQRSVGVKGLVAPNSFEIALSPEDFERFEPFADAFVRELADTAKEHANEEGYLFLGPVEVAVVLDETLGKGVFMIAADIVSGEVVTSAGSLVLPDGTRIAIEAPALTIGRLPECDVVLADPNVSRRHAEVRRDGDQARIVDLGSTNGIRVNGAHVTEEDLSDGDVITLGATKVLYEAG